MYLVITLLVLGFILVGSIHWYFIPKWDKEYDREFELKTARRRELNDWLKEQEESPRYFVRIKTITGDRLDSAPYDYIWAGLDSNYRVTSEEAALNSIHSKYMFVSREGIHVSPEAIVLRQIVKEEV